MPASVAAAAFLPPIRNTLVAPGLPEPSPRGSGSLSRRQTIMADEINSVNRTTAKYNRSDNDFLGFNLGVLRPLTMPGTLSEGSFHDYIPESWRLKNDKYLKHESWAIARSFLQYFKNWVDFFSK